MNPRNHHIGKLVMNLEFDSEQAANELQKSFTGTFETLVKAALDEVFSAFSYNGETIVIDQLKINLGAISQDNFAGTLKTEVQNALQKLLISEIKDKNSQEVIRIPTSQTGFEIFVFFLQNGYFPWWAYEITMEQLEISIIHETSFSDTIIRSKFGEILQSSISQKRLAVQFSEDFNRQLISNFYPEPAAFIFLTIEQIKKLFSQNNISDEKIRSEWPALVWPLLIHHVEITGFQRYFPIKLLTSFCEKFDLESKEIIAQLPDNSVFEPHFILEKEEILESPFQGIKKDQEKTEQSPAEILVSNAGLVIFWPFLEQLFTSLMLMKEKTFLSDQHHEKAVLITQFLVTGEVEAEEFQLPLNKLIAGWPLNAPLQKEVLLDENEKAIAEDFLKEIIKNWPALKNTSIAGLQETFIRRNGILRESDQKWLLKVTRKTVDILRDSLPWPVSIIKLPWMDKILYVEW